MASQRDLGSEPSHPSRFRTQDAGFGACVVDCGVMSCLRPSTGAGQATRLIVGRYREAMIRQTRRTLEHWYPELGDRLDSRGR